ncbi:Type II secretion system protein E [Rubripirellula tenax]|uniref:Type II secretion system protein E n=1 Tax=Rubripirellula tenax TaxID=2528015 RepID=A0A5C6FJK3_9BACT|nr:ATPase, T2SS/T4P/T4SS family [Rubripirellula tenax]TWU60783.1 Type II secretion system protein E [Rubripirellula tenax]
MNEMVAAPPKQVVHDPLIVRLINTLNCLEPARLEMLYQAAEENDISFDELAVDSGLADERLIAETYAKHYLLPMFDPPADVAVPVDVLVSKMLPAEFCRRHRIAPLSVDGQTIEIAMFSPDSLLLADEIRLAAGRQMRPMFTTLSVIRRLLDVMYDEQQVCQGTSPTLTTGLPSIQSCAPWFDVSDHRITLPLAAANYMNELVDHALSFGIQDVHIEPVAEGHRVRLRFDQTLEDYDHPSPTWSGDIVQQLESLGRIVEDSDDVPREGSFQLRGETRLVDVRVNTCPTLVGVKTVLRLIDRQSVPVDLVDLGMTDRQRDDLSDALRGEGGIVLVAGPLGSGKSTTLAACLRELQNEQSNIYAVEENIDLPIPGVHQVRLQNDCGLTYAATLRGLLRQDPDVIMVGELDHEKTADACFRAASGGRMILTSMRDANSIGCVDRLAELGIKPTTAARSLRAIVSQRMARRLCDNCKTLHAVDPAWATKFAIAPGEKLYRPNGCDQCRQSGYRGRVPIFEVIRVTRPIAEMIANQEGPGMIRRAVVDNGVRLLRQSAIDKAIAGETSLKAAVATFGTR